MKQRIKKILLWIVIIGITSGVIVAGRQWAAKQEILQRALAPDAGQTQEVPEPPAEEPIPEEPEEPEERTMLPELESVYAQNEDLVGWLRVPQTNIDFPVVQSTDNEYYLHRDFNKKKLFDGTPFMDFRNKIEPQLHDNTLIYGHNMGRKGTVFTELMRYTNIEFYKKAPVIEFDTLYEKGQWKVVAVLEANTDPRFGAVFEYYNYVVAKDQANFDWFMDEITRRSYYHTDVDVQLGDNLLTLQTCTNDRYETKLIVVARRVRAGESAEVDLSKAVVNPNRVLPR